MKLDDIQETHAQLAPSELLVAGDYIEWSTNAFTKVDPRSLLVGKPVSALPQVHTGVCRLRPAEAYRRITQ